MLLKIASSLKPIDDSSMVFELLCTSCNSQELKRSECETGRMKGNLEKW